MVCHPQITLWPRGGGKEGRYPSYTLPPADVHSVGTRRSGIGFISQQHEKERAARQLARLGGGMPAIEVNYHAASAKEKKAASTVAAPAKQQGE